MKRWATLCLAAAAALGPAQAAAPEANTCRVPDYVVHVEGKLPRVALMAKEHHLEVLVLGTGSSMLGGPAGATSAYPARLEAALRKQLPGVAVTVRTDVKSRRTTADMAKQLPALTAEGKPGLVIWQTGTVDAMRGIDPDEFRLVLETGVQRLLKAGIDVVLMNMQYSPRTEAMIVAGPYADAMRVVAQQNDVPLFDRAAAMKYWSEHGVFDFSGADGTQIAERVHDCIGRVLAAMVLESAGLEPAKPKDNR